MLKQASTRKQGDVGTAYAVSYYARNGFTVSIPLADSQPYDLIVDKDGIGLKRVQVKTSTKVTPTGHYSVELRTISNRRGGKLEIRKFSKQKADILFIVCGDERMFAIPADLADGMAQILVTKRFPLYEVK